MSTVVYKNGLRIWVNPREPQHKGRPHCHVKKGDAEATIDIETVEVMASNGRFSKGDMVLILQLVEAWREDLAEKWEEYHGKE